MHTKASDTASTINNDGDLTFADWGFMATHSLLIIQSAYPGYTVWNRDAYNFLKYEGCPETINPLLFRQV